MTPEQLLQYLAVVATLGAAYIAWRKASPERRRLGVETTGIAVDAQAKIIDDLQSVNNELRVEMATMKREHHEEISAIKASADEARASFRAELGELREENERLTSRIFGLEEKLA